MQWIFASKDEKRKLQGNKLVECARRGELAKVDKLLSKGALVNHVDPGDWTPLMAACQRGHVQTVAKLLEKGADVNAKDKGDTTALMLACTEGHVQVAAQLLASGADVCARDEEGRTALMLACLSGIKDVPTANSTVPTASRERYLQLVAKLLENGADINAQTKEGLTPLIVACLPGHVQIVAELLERGADVNAQEQSGGTALMVACAFGHPQVATKLLEHGADVNAKDKDGKTAADWASESESNQEATLAALKAAAHVHPTPLPKQPAATTTQEQHLLPSHQPTTVLQSTSITLPPEYTEKVSSLDSMLVQAGLAGVGSVVQGMLTCNPAALLTGCMWLLRAASQDAEALEYCKRRIGRIAARVDAMLPALQELEQVLLSPPSASARESIVQPLAKNLVMLAQVLMAFRILQDELCSSGRRRLAAAMRLLKAQGYRERLEMLEQDFRDCLTQLTTIISISSYTEKVALAVQSRQELQVVVWGQQNQEDWKQDMGQLEQQVLAVAGGVEALGRQLSEQQVELDGQRVALQDVLQWLQLMGASSAVIAGHLQAVERKVDLANEQLGGIKDDIGSVKDQLEKFMLQGKKQGQWSPSDRLPDLAIAASQIDAGALEQAVKNAASGAFGCVVPATMDSVTKVALKVFNFKNRGDRDCKEAVREAVLLSMANSEHVVRCYGLVFDPESGKNASIHGSLVMEWVGGGTLYEWLQNEENEELGLRERVQLALQVAVGMKHLHSKRLVHGDLKPENVLLTEATPTQPMPQAKICDFGLAKYTSASMRPTYTPKTDYTLVYTSPERIRNYLRTPQDDAYAFGMLLYFIATSVGPLSHIPQPLMRDAILNNARPDQPSIEAWVAEVSESGGTALKAAQLYCQLANDCWAADPQQRPDFIQIHQRLAAVARLLQGAA